MLSRISQAVPHFSTMLGSQKQIWSQNEHARYSEYGSACTLPKLALCPSFLQFGRDDYKQNRIPENFRQIPGCKGDSNRNTFLLKQLAK